MNYDIAKRRLELGLTLEEVGKYVGVGKSTVSKWEKGKISNMRLHRIPRLAEILGISPLTILENSKDTAVVMACRNADGNTDAEQSDETDTAADGKPFINRISKATEKKNTSAGVETAGYTESRAKAAQDNPAATEPENSRTAIATATVIARAAQSEPTTGEPENVCSIAPAAAGAVTNNIYAGSAENEVYAAAAISHKPPLFCIGSVIDTGTLIYEKNGIAELEKLAPEDYAYIMRTLELLRSSQQPSKKGKAV